jgi:parvulin-like peptidyl-prolyl isomerase
MTRKTTKLFPAALGAFLLAGTAGAQTNAGASAKASDKMDELFGSSIVAKGKGVEVKRSQLDSTMVNIKASFAARGQVITPEQTIIVERQVLSDLINVQLLLGQATEADKARGKEVSDKRFADVRTRAGSDETLNRQLKSVGMTQVDLRTQMLDQAIAEAVAQRELKVSVSDADAKKYYDENPARFEQPEMVRVSQIMLSTVDLTTRAPLSDEQQKAKRKQMADILKRAKGGEDFAKLAKEYSESPGAKENGGELKPFARGTMPETPEFEAAAFSLNTNQISDIITTPYGYHIIKLVEKIPAKKIELATAANDLKEALKLQEMRRQLPEFMAKLKKDAAVEILDEKLKAADVPAYVPAEPANTEKAQEKKPDDKK